MTKKAEKNIVEIYSYDSVLEKCIAYFHGDELAATTWISKYALKDKNKNFIELSPDDMHLRMAKEFARKEKEYATIQNLNVNNANLSAYGKKRKLLDEIY